ncbi:hypothetical protein [Peribacillus loiseleuriae]|uniref:hypothetical protein n=1 Tax=Peribacillus loiseleuriae TaxID=1679170 RepID=UPI003D03DC86
MITKFLLESVSYILYLILISCIGVVVYEIIKQPLKIRFGHLRYRTQIKRARIIDLGRPLQTRSKFYRHIYYLLTVKDDDIDSLKIYSFVVVSLFLGVSSLIIFTLRFEDIIVSLLFSSIISLLPYGFVWVRMKSIRSNIGNSLIDVVELLIHSYAASGRDIYQALKVSQSQVKQIEIRRVLVRLIGDLQVAKSENELKESIDLFIYTSGSSWGMRLGNIILKAYIHQENVGSALLTLQQQMINNEKMLEQEKTHSYDVNANAILSLILLPVSLIGAKYITRPQDWWNLQFQNKWPFMVLVLTFLMTFIGFIMALVISKPKNDL